ncbi:MAG: hypothetical protein NUW07_03055, partial [Candidatus Saccharicenans sp.]|nr:hypothetical protein [Candidatus Saccharicenans sp.]
KKMFRKFFCFARRSEAEADGNAGRDSIKVSKRILFKESSNLVQKTPPFLINFPYNQPLEQRQ